MDSVAEVWKSVVGFEGSYEVSSLGRVKSLSRKLIRSNGSPQTVRERIMTQCVDNSNGGYLCVCIGKKSKSVHGIAAKAFLGLPPVGSEVNHRDGNKLNNEHFNLEYVTHRQNMEHASRHGLLAPQRGSLNAKARLSEGEVKEIVKLLREGMKQKQIAAIYGVCKSTVGEIGRGRNWRHITVCEEQNA